MPAYISEIVYNVSQYNFIEVAVAAGTDVSGYQVAIYDGSGVLKGTMSFGSPDTTIARSDVYSFDEGTTGWYQFGTSEAIALIDGAGNVVQFVSFEDKTVTASGGPADGETSTSIGYLDTGQSLESTDDCSSYQVQASPNQGTIPCYAPGTLIETSRGPERVELLVPGDMVRTLDHGFQPIRWVSRRAQSFERCRRDAQPVLVKAGAFGPDQPYRDLVVSAQHRLLVGGRCQLENRFGAEALAPAKSLTATARIRFMAGKKSMIWVHFACARHGIVYANGCLSESLLLGSMVVNGLTRRERKALIGCFGPAPSRDAPLNGPPARQCLTPGAVRRVLAQGRGEKRKGMATEIPAWDPDLAVERHKAESLRASLLQDLA